MMYSFQWFIIFSYFYQLTSSIYLNYENIHRMINNKNNNNNNNNKYLTLNSHRIENIYYSKLNNQNLNKTNGLLKANLNFIKLGFYTEVFIGSELDPVKVLIDTGSSDFWVPNINLCNDNNINEISYNCSKFGHFDPIISSTFRPNKTDFLLTYGDGSISIGEFGQDSVTLNDITINNVNLAIANFTNTTSGILGLGYKSTESTNYNFGLNRKPFNYTNFPQQLVNDGIINKSIYSLYLDKNGNAELLFGAIDHEKYYGNLYEFPVISMKAESNANINRTSSNSSNLLTRIAITLNSISIKNRNNEEIIVGDGFVPVILDSGTTTAAFPKGIAITIGYLLDLTYDSDLDYFFGSCSKIENSYFNFNFQGVEFVSPISSYFLQIFKNDYNVSEGCIFQVYITNDDFIILGDSFLRDMYTVIDLDDNLVSLAYKKNSLSNNIEIIDNKISNVIKPPNSATYGFSNSKFKYFDTFITTKSSEPTKIPLSLHTELATIHINDDFDCYDYHDYYDNYAYYYDYDGIEGDKEDILTNKRNYLKISSSTVYPTFVISKPTSINY